MEYLLLAAHACVTIHPISLCSRSELRLQCPEQPPCMEAPRANGSPQCIAYIHQLSVTAYMMWGGSHLFSIDSGWFSPQPSLLCLREAGQDTLKQNTPTPQIGIQSKTCVIAATAGRLYHTVQEITDVLIQGWQDSFSCLSRSILVVVSTYRHMEARHTTVIKDF